MRDAEELPIILAELEDAWRVVERSLCVIVCSTIILLDLTGFEAKSSYRLSEHLSNICRDFVLLSKISKN